MEPEHKEPDLRFGGPIEPGDIRTQTNAKGATMCETDRPR